MLWDASTIIGCRLLGRDGEGGTVSDLLFDDTSWRMRWIVMDKPCWFRREVLLPVSAIRQPDVVGRRIVVGLTRAEISGSVAAELRPPVSQPRGRGRRDLHLRSIAAVIGHRVHLTDGVIGHVEELLVEDSDWDIRFLRIDTCKWRPGERVLLAPRSIREIDWPGRLVRVDLCRREIETNAADRHVIWTKA
ncbi:MAG: PRC-barrel domain-containing protein [Enhydrobacter sp.]|nr:PRC-barrel domain-containing protein [Enhydrobacter sp.]